MNSPDMLSRAEIDALFPTDLPEPEFWEQQYPPRDLPEAAEVTRFGPSPTGSAHLGGIYAALLDTAIARQSGGVYFVRVEDTDQDRQVAGAAAQFDHSFAYFGVQSDETDPAGAYGPYTQSQRSRIYLTYVREFLRQGRAYLCFATRQELEAATREQREQGVPTGYWERWATWRDAPVNAVRSRLAAGDPYVVRFRSPGEQAGRIACSDQIRGRIEAEENRNDAVILKSSANELRLPTYHFASVVDDLLMRVTLVIRGDEWLPSVPLHLQLYRAIGAEPPAFAHIAPLMKLDGKSKRKLSKRKDPEASVDFYIAGGYPAEAVRHYLRGLANGRLADMPFEQARRELIRLAECGVAGPLVDLVKLEDICADLIAAMSGEDILDHLAAWAETHDPGLAAVLAAERDLALRALAIERDGVANARKDLRKWSDFRSVYGYFFPALFAPVDNAGDARFGGLEPALVRDLAGAFLDGYRHTEDGDAWFEQVKAAAAVCGFAPTPKEYKRHPEAYPGSIREAAQVIRVLLTGSTRSPAFHLVAAVMGEAEVRRRIAAVGTGPTN